MYPDSKYAVPISSFQTPVPLPGSEPDEDPMAQICVNLAWLPYIIGSLKQLLLQSTWDTDDPETLAAVQGQVFQLIGLFQPGLSSCGYLNYVPVPWLFDAYFGDYAYSHDIDYWHPNYGSGHLQMIFAATYLEIRGAERSNPSQLCGGLIQAAYFRSTSPLAHIDVIAHDCEDNELSAHVVGQFGLSQLGNPPLVLKNLQLTCPVLGSWWAVNSGDVVCEVS